MIRLGIVIVISVISYATGLKEPRPDRGPEMEDRRLNPLQVIQKYGYPAEFHSVTTEDGYILALHRIPYGRLCSQEESKGVVLLQHGLFCSSMDWILLGTKRGLAYILADECYDVWMPNSRGNTYSRRHAKLNPETKEYWDFSWHEMGIYDTPAAIDYILNRTGAKDLYYIGHSQGTTSFLVLGSQRQDYNDKIRAAFLLAPIAFVGETTSPLIKIAARTQSLIGALVTTFTKGEFMPSNILTSEVAALACANIQPVTPEICKSMIFLISGFDSDQFNSSLLYILFGHTPAGCSIKQLQHYGQNCNTGKFRLYDYGAAGNREIYDQIEPPDYDLKKIQIPTILFYSLNDWLAVLDDVEKLTSRLGNLKEEYVITYDKFNHVDYMYATDVIPYLYAPLVESMSKY